MAQTNSQKILGNDLYEIRHISYMHVLFSLSTKKSHLPPWLSNHTEDWHMMKSCRHTTLTCDITALRDSLWILWNKLQTKFEFPISPLIIEDKMIFIITISIWSEITPKIKKIDFVNFITESEDIFMDIFSKKLKFILLVNAEAPLTAVKNTCPKVDLFHWRHLEEHH